MPRTKSWRFCVYPCHSHVHTPTHAHARIQNTFGHVFLFSPRVCVRVCVHIHPSSWFRGWRLHPATTTKQHSRTHRHTVALTHGSGAHHGNVSLFRWHLYVSEHVQRPEWGVIEKGRGLRCSCSSYTRQRTCCYCLPQNTRAHKH